MQFYTPPILPNQPTQYADLAQAMMANGIQAVQSPPQAVAQVLMGQQPSAPTLSEYDIQDRYGQADRLHNQADYLHHVSGQQGGNPLSAIANIVGAYRGRKMRKRAGEMEREASDMGRDFSRQQRERKSQDKQRQRAEAREDWDYRFNRQQQAQQNQQKHQFEREDQRYQRQRRDTLSDRANDQQFRLSLAKMQKGEHPNFDDAAKLRTEFMSHTGGFQKSRDAFGKIQAAASQPSAAGDVSLIFSYMKMLDPGSVVRESEFATAENAASVPERVRQTYNKALRGEALTESIRNDFVKQSGLIYNRALETYKQQREQYHGLAQRMGYNPDQIYIDRPVIEPGAESAAINPQTGQKLVLRNGQWQEM